MKYPQHPEEIEHLLRRQRPLSIIDFSAVLREMPIGSVYALIRKLQKEGRLCSTGKGKYTSVCKPEYHPVVTSWMQEVADKLIDACEGIDNCIIDRGKNLEVQVYKKDIPKVLEALSAVYEKVVLKKDAAPMISKLEGFILLAPMVTEAPLIEREGVFVPSFEKTLVDSLCSGADESVLLEEIRHYAKAYPLRYDRLRRYASRRGVRDKVGRLLEYSTPV